MEDVRTQDFSENEDENHADEQPWLLGSATDTSVTDDADGEAGSKASETDRETSAELDEAREQRGLLLQIVGDQDRDDETVDTDDTSHNNGDNVCQTLLGLKGENTKVWAGGKHTLDDEIRSKNTHGRDTDARFGGSIGCAKACEDDGGGATHGAEEGL